MTFPLPDKEMYKKGIEILLKDGWTLERINKLQFYQVTAVAETELLDPDQPITESFEDEFNLLDEVIEFDE